MVVTYQYQPTVKVYTWNDELEQWTDQNITPLFGGMSNSVNDSDAVVFNDELFLVCAFNGGSQFVTYKRSVGQPYKLLKRPLTAPSSSGAGAKLIIFNNKLYCIIAHTNTPFFRLYEYNSSLEDWEAIAPPADLPTGNGGAVDAVVFESELFIAIGHISSPFVTTYRYNTSGTWTRIANPPTLPINTANEVAFIVIEGVLHLVGISSGTNGIFSYRYVSGAWQNTARQIENVGTSNIGVSTIEYQGNYYAFFAANIGPQGYMYRWDGTTSTWLNDTGFLPPIKSGLSRTMMYKDGSDLYVAYSTSSDASGQSRLEVFKREANNWVTIYLGKILSEAALRMRFFKFEGIIHLIVGMQWNPGFRIYRLSENPFEEVWSKQPLDYASYVGIAKDSGNAGDEIDIYVVKN